MFFTPDDSDPVQSRCELTTLTQARKEKDKMKEEAQRREEKSKGTPSKAGINIINSYSYNCLEYKKNFKNQKYFLGNMGEINKKRHPFRIKIFFIKHQMQLSLWESNIKMVKMANDSNLNYKYRLHFIFLFYKPVRHLALLSNSSK